LITLQDVQEAKRLLEPVVNRTPVMTSRTLNRVSGAEVYLKCENYQRTGSFKFRGAYNALSHLSEEELAAGVITHSSGNHAQALALAAATASVRARIVMPKSSSPVKMEAVKSYGAEVVLCENSLASREKTTEALIAAQGFSLIHPFNNEQVMAGAGTAVIELLEEVGRLDLVVAPVGGGGLLSGTAVGAKGLYPEITVWGVEPAESKDAYNSFRSGKLEVGPYSQTIADGLRVCLGELPFQVIRKYVDDIVLAEEEEIVEAMRFLWERMKLVVEPSGAVSLVPVLKARLPQRKALRVGVIISGGNVNLGNFFNGYLEKK